MSLVPFYRQYLATLEWRKTNDIEDILDKPVSERLVFRFQTHDDYIYTVTRNKYCLKRPKNPAHCFSNPRNNTILFLSRDHWIKRCET